MKLSELINFQSNQIYLDEIKANRRNIVPFVGAGISKGCGLYTWGELLHKLAVDYLTADEIEALEKEGDFYKYADRIVQSAGNSDMIIKKIRRIFSETKVTLTEVPYLLVTSFSPTIVTTNYDSILENVSKEVATRPLKPLLPCLVGQMNEAIQWNDRCLLKIHGSVEEISSFVFTAKQYKQFYGEIGNREGRLLPAYLTKIFTGKKVLFVGCSLDKDNTLEILEECIQQNQGISHYAIVPYHSDKEKLLEQNRRWTNLGIEPVYYPEGDFDAVVQLINYLAEENGFVGSMKHVLSEYVNLSENSELQVLITILNESFYSTALKYPELLDIDIQKKCFVDEILEFIGKMRRQTDTLFSICKGGFEAYIKTGYIRCEQEVLKYFSNQFKESALKAGEIDIFLQKKWSIKRNMQKGKRNDFTWIRQVSDEEINKYAEALLKKLQYKNGMSYTEIGPAYEEAKRYINIVADKIDFNTRIRLLNSLGAFGPLFQEGEAAIDYLERAIDEIEISGDTSRDTMLFKAKCYGNLAIALARSTGDIYSILDAIEHDVNLKKKYGESMSFYMRSLNFYATILKEVDPFKACDVYLEVADWKKKIINSGKNVDEVKELTASWATTVFNIGLLAKDIELYDLAYSIIAVANDYRFSTVDYCNMDYCCSVNVSAELETFIHKKQNLEWLIHGVESRVDLPIGFSKTLAHTWYVCANYYYVKGEYTIAIKYINKSIEESKKDGALEDFLQDIRTRLLLGKIKAAQARMGLAKWEFVESIYIDIINDVMAVYGSESFYLIAPYRYLLNVDVVDKKQEYEKRYAYLTNKYKKSIMEFEDKLEKYFKIEFQRM